MSHASNNAEGPAAGGRTDLRNRDDVELLVGTFYRRVFRDEALGPVFIDVAQMDLAAHLPIMCDFWETVLFRAGLYKRNALHVHEELHAKVALSWELFERWLQAWQRTVDDLFVGEKAELAKVQAGRIAGSIHRVVNGGRASEYSTIRRGGQSASGR